MKVIVRVDASLPIGSGHVMRCLTLANALRESGADVRFICREHEGNLCAAITGQGFEVQALPVEDPEGGSPAQASEAKAHAAWLGADWRVDAERTCAAIERWGRADWIIVDHYALDVQWERAVRASSKWLMVIDDLADRPHDCDLLLDQNYFGERSDRYDERVAQRCTKLLGPEFALIRPQFASARAHAARGTAAMRRAFVFFGGSDLTNETGKGVHAILAMAGDGLEADVVVGAANPHAAAIEALCSRHPRLRVHRYVPDMAELMAAADVSIGAGGTTTWERCCLGVPSLVVSVAGNQEPICEAMARDGYIAYLGKSVEVPVERITRALESLAEDPRGRDRMRVKGQTLVDGLGARRVAGALGVAGVRMLRLRRADLRDMDLYFRWANDLEVRKQSLSVREISPEEHRAWFTGRVTSANARLWLAETQDGQAVGQARLESTPSGWRLDYSVSPDSRGQGHAWPMLDLAFRELSREVAAGRILAEVKVGNHRSARVLTSLGFAELPDREAGIKRYEKRWGSPAECNAL